MHQVVFFMFILICMGMIHSYAFHGHDQESYLTKFLQLQRKMKYQPWSKPDVGALDFASVGKMEDDLIHGLPGQPSTVNFKQYAGYVTVDVLKGRELFYYFAEVDQDNPSSKPLILWLNGGPGCSSIGVGAMTENGPFGVQNDGRTLYKRQYSWNRVANMLFLESPAGVGFSYSNTSSDYNTTGDSRTARDSFTFLLTWLKRFPHYKLVDFYIMGESYAGYYIPELADVIIHHNLRADPDDIIHLKRIMVIRELCMHFWINWGLNGIFVNNCRKVSRHRYFRQIQLPGARAQLLGHPDAVLSFATLPSHPHVFRGLFGSPGLGPRHKALARLLYLYREDALN